MKSQEMKLLTSWMQPLGGVPVYTWKNLPITRVTEILTHRRWVMHMHASVDKASLVQTTACRQTGDKHDLKPWWLIVNWTHGKNFSKIPNTFFISWNEFENVVSKKGIHFVLALQCKWIIDCRDACIIIIWIWLILLRVHLLFFFSFFFSPMWQIVHQFEIKKIHV